MHQWIKFIYFRVTLYMFRTVFPSIIRVPDCTCSNRHLSNRYCCLYSFLASRQQYLYDKCLLLYVQSWTLDDRGEDRPKHVECHSKINKFDTSVHVVGFTIGIRRSTLHTLFAHSKNFHIFNSTGECQDRSRNLSKTTERTTPTWLETRDVT
jgi:hypothetical protein